MTPAAEKVSPEQSSVSTKAPGISTTKAFKKPAPKPPVLTKAQREEAARQAKIRAQKAFEAEQARCQAISSQAEAVQQFIRDMGWNNEQDLNIFQQTAHRVALQGPQLTIPADEAEMPDPIEVSAIGINNLGYTCWLSSALQFFVHHSELADALCNADVSELGVLDKQGDFVAGELRTMQNLLRKIFISLRTQAPEGKRHNVNALLIQDLLVEIDRLDLVKGGGRVPLPNYFNGRQHEAKGFIQELLSAFGLLLPANVDDEKLVKSIKIYTNPTPQDGYYKRPTPMPHSPILSVGVTDGDNEMEFFDLNDMTEKGFIPAEQLVRCSGRTLENGEQQEYEDVKGNPTHAFDYKEYITSLPTNLTISFNRTLRIQQGIDKLERPIFRDQELRKKLKLEPSFTDQIPNCIEMFEYSEDLAYDENGVARAQPTKVCYYKIRGIVVHEAGVIKGAAGVDGGHYVYIRQTEDGTLRRYSDTSIHTIHSLETALEGACFLDLELVEKVDYNEAFDDEEEVVLDASQEFPSYELAELLGTPKNGGQAPATPATAPLSEPHKPTTPKENSTPIPGTFPTVPLDNTLEPTPPLENSSLIPEDSPTVPLDNTLEANSPLVKEEKPQDPEPAPQDKQPVGKTPWFSVIKKIFGTSKQSKAQ